MRGALYGKLENLSSMTPTEAAAAVREVATGMKAINAQYPVPRATFEIFMQHVTHALDLVGPEHVGVGADWDGGAAAWWAWKTWRRSPKSPNGWSSWAIRRRNSPASGAVMRCAYYKAVHEARKTQISA